MKAGNRLYKGVEIPFNAKVCIDKNGTEFYVSGTNNDNGIWNCIIKYILTGEIKLVSYNLIEKYL